MTPGDRRHERGVVIDGRRLLRIFFTALLVVLAACQGPPSKDGNGRPPFSDDEYPVGYSLGKFDGRFGISKRDFLGVVGEAKSVWEKAAGRPLFRFDSSASFRVNLIFDDRQQRTLDARKLKASIDSKGRSYDALVWQHDRRMERLAESQKKYDEGVAAMQQRLGEYNARVTAWNDRGGAQPDEFARLNREQEELERGQESLERMRTELNEDIAAVNELVAEINEVASAENLEVTYFNGKFVESREFEQGVFTGRDITIYQFSGIADLRIALVHEFGHALGFDHVDDPAAIMYYRMGEQNMTTPTLAAADIALLRKKFPGE
jgi:hypothetical protein